MRTTNNSFKWLIGLVLFTSLVSFSGFARTLPQPQNIRTTELVANSSSTSATRTIAFSTYNHLKNKSLSQFLSFDFNSFLRAYEASFLIKLKIQNVIFCKDLSAFLSSELKLFPPSNSEEYENIIFIG